MSHAGGEGCKKHDVKPFDPSVKDQEDLMTGIVARLREAERLAYSVFEMAATGFSTLCDDRHAIDLH